MAIPVLHTMVSIYMYQVPGYQYTVYLLEDVHGTLLQYKCTWYIIIAILVACYCMAIPGRFATYSRRYTSVPVPTSMAYENAWYCNIYGIACYTLEYTVRTRITIHQT